MRLLTLLLVGCAVVEDTVTPVDTPEVDTPDTVAPVDTPEGIDTPEVIDTPEPPEVVGLCDLTITCPGPIPDAPRIACNLVVADAAGTVSWDGRAGMQLRGRSSAGFPKPQLSVELWDAADQEQSASLLGMGAEADWVINGAYIDRALLRNQLAFDLFQGLGGPERYAPESHTCRATFNGRAAGVFFLTETIKRDDDRIDVPDDPNGEAFVVKLDDEPGLLDNSAVGYGIWQAVSPRSPTPQQSAGILAALGGWQGALLGARPADPVDGIFAYVDPDSAVDFVLLQELMRNNDAYYLSVHLWKDVGGRLRFAPWDLDLTLGQPTYNDNTNPEGWVAYRPTMIARMGEVEAFRTALAQRWRDLRAGPWSDVALLDAVNAQHDLLGLDLQANFAVWTWTDIPLYWSTLPEVAGPEEEYDRIRAWLPARTAWIDGAIDGW